MWRSSNDVTHYQLLQTGQAEALMAWSALSTTPLLFYAHSPGTSMNIYPHNSYIDRNYSPLADSMGYHLLKFRGGSEKHTHNAKKSVECVMTVQGQPRSLMISVSTESACDLNVNLGPTLHRLWKVENRYFSLHHSHLTPYLGVNPFEFPAEPDRAKSRLLGLSAGEDFTTLACVVVWNNTSPLQTDGRTDGHVDDSCNSALHSKLRCRAVKQEA